MTIINQDIKLSKKQLPEVNTMFNSIAAGDRYELSRAITLVESEEREDKKIARDLIEKCLTKNSKKTIRIGISGSPGAGKSTLLEALGMFLIGQDFKPAVLTIDPSSSMSSGSILGDKTRMQLLSNTDKAYIRSSPARGILGGVGKNTRESVLLLEAAGFDPVFIETVGVGQSETEVANMTDIFIFVLQPGSGDDLQGMKKGIMEIADIIVVNKFDTDYKNYAVNTYNHYSGVMQFLLAKENGWQKKILLTSALENRGISELWENIALYCDTILQNGYYDQNRNDQNIKWFRSIFINSAMEVISNNFETNYDIVLLENKILEGSLSPYEASEILIKKVLK